LFLFIICVIIWLFTFKFRVSIRLILPVQSSLVKLGSVSHVIGECVIHGKEFRPLFRVVVNAKCLEFSIIFDKGWHLQEAVERELLFESLLLEVKRVYAGFGLKASCHVFAEERLDVLFLSVTIQTPAWRGDSIASVIQLGHIDLGAENGEHSLVQSREVVRVIVSQTLFGC
jgi:hypothetical protein